MQRLIYFIKLFQTVVWFKKTKILSQFDVKLCRTPRFSKLSPTLLCRWYFNRCRKTRRHFASMFLVAVLLFNCCDSWLMPTSHVTCFIVLDFIMLIITIWFMPCTHLCGGKLLPRSYDFKVTFGFLHGSYYEHNTSDFKVDKNYYNLSKKYVRLARRNKLGSLVTTHVEVSHWLTMYSA
jgi:hypothetical protein